jgi:hypothetical protein
MKKLVLTLLVIAGMLSGCFYDPNRDRHHDGVYHGHDRDGDGVPNRDDSRPNNPNRY